MPYTAKQIESLIQQGENQTVEFKTNIREPSLLARLIASFANAEGGLIIIGVEEKPIKILGVNSLKIKRLYDTALNQLHNLPQTSLEVVDLDGKQLVVISVEKSNTIVLTNQGAFLRSGEMIIPMSPSDVSTALAPKDLQISDREGIAEGISELTNMVEQLQNQLTESNSFQGQIKVILISGFVGAVLSLILTLIFT